jgi:hypothetical protein
MMENSIILIRTSTKEQNPKLQLNECKEFNKSKDWDCIKVFERQESAYKNEEGVWKEEIEFAKNNEVKHIVVWNMDRFSRLPEEKVLSQVKILSTIYNLQVHAVHGDVWSEIVESIGKLKDMGFIGEAISEFLEKLLRGLEFQRANRESKVKSERVKLAVRKKEDEVTKSYKGNKWGRKSIQTNRLREEVLKLKETGLTIRDISKQIYYYDKNNNKKNPSPSLVHKLLNKIKSNISSKENEIKLSN